MKSNIELQNLEIGLRREIEAAASPAPNDFTTRIPPDAGDTLDNLGVNYIDNSDFDFSTDAYLNSTPAGGDTAEECFNFYRQRFIRITDAVLEDGSTTLYAPSAPFSASYSYPMNFFALRAGTGEKALVGTLTRDDDNNATMSAASEADITDGIVFFGEAYAESSARALKASGHSLFAANEGANEAIARWDKSAGQAEIGGLGGASADNFDLTVPLPFNLATRGLEMFFSVNVKLRDGAEASEPVRLYAGIFDTTSGNAKFLEGDNFDLTVTVEGTPGATEYECVVVGTFFSGEQIISDIVTVSNAPDTLDADNFLHWDWRTAPRILDWTLFRRNTATGDTVRVFSIYNGETRFFDKNENGEASEPDLPTAPARRAYAYAESLSFIPSADYRRVPILFRIPPTYAQGDTTGRQVLRIGIYNHADNDVRCAVIDRVMLSLKPSVWNRSARDLERIQQTAPTSTTPDGSQTGCFTGDTLIIAKKRPEDDWAYLPIAQAKRGMFVYNGKRTDRILDVSRACAVKLFRVRLANGIEFECSASQKFITSPSDICGTRFDRFAEGDFVQTVNDRRVSLTEIISITPQIYEQPKNIYTLRLENDKIFIVAGAKRPSGETLLFGVKAHNAKQGDYDIILV